jgi:hypothetical protein
MGCLKIAGRAAKLARLQVNDFADDGFGWAFRNNEGALTARQCRTEDSKDLVRRKAQGDAAREYNGKRLRRL